MRKLLALLFLLVASICEAQTTNPVAPRVLRYQENKLAWDIDAQSSFEATTFKYKVYLFTNQIYLVETPITCTGETNPRHCETIAPEFVVGSNVLQMTASSPTNTNESPKSNVLEVFYATAVKETIVNTEKQSILRCQPGSFEMLRITDATKMQAALNASTKHVAYMFATSNAVYAIFCTLLESGT